METLKIIWALGTLIYFTSNIYFLIKNYSRNKRQDLNSFLWGLFVTILLTITYFLWVL